jgi:hypothetical protein
MGEKERKKEKLFYDSGVNCLDNQGFSNRLINCC